MSATNKTTNYELPVFIGTDKPAWLVDWNGAMNLIDTAIKQAETKADTAGVDIGSIQSDIITINSALTTLNGAVSQLRIDTNANTGAINTIQELIGNGTPTTTDHTIIGAINELHSDIQGISGEVYDFDLSAATVGTITSPVSGVTVDGSGTDISALLNANCSVGKVYGILSFTLSNASFNAGTLFASIPITGLTVDTPFRVAGYGMYVIVNGDIVMITIELGFRTGGVDIYWTGGNVGASVTKAYTNLPPCLLFLKDLGD